MHLQISYLHKLRVCEDWCSENERLMQCSKVSNIKGGKALPEARPGPGPRLAQGSSLTLYFQPGLGMPAEDTPNTCL